MWCVHVPYESHMSTTAHRHQEGAFPILCILTCLLVVLCPVAIVQWLCPAHTHFGIMAIFPPADWVWGFATSVSYSMLSCQDHLRSYLMNTLLMQRARQ